jgi:hypothetical protein
MPKEYLECVRSEMDRGKSRADAQRICAIAYYKRHGKRPQDVEDAEVDWTKIEAICAAGVDAEPIMAEASITSILADSGPDATEKASSDDVILIFDGVVLVDEAVHAGGYIEPPVYFPHDSNDTVMMATNMAMADGDPVTTYQSHAAVYSGGLPFGRLGADLWRDASEIKFRAEVYGTTLGKDIAVLIRNRVMTKVSFRMSRYALEEVAVGGRQLSKLVWGVFDGIDMAQIPAIMGARVTEIRAEEDKAMTDQKGVLERLDQLIAALQSPSGGQTPTALTAALELIRPIRDDAVALTASLVAVQGDLEAARTKLQVAEGRVSTLEAAAALTTRIAELMEGRSNQWLLYAEVKRRATDVKALEGDAGVKFVDGVVQELTQLAAAFNGGSTFGGSAQVSAATLAASGLTEIQREVRAAAGMR